MNTSLVTTATLALFVALSSCARDDGTGPPTVAYDSDACHECGMIISDARYACATVITGDRGATAVLFDDFNCQVNYELEHADVTILQRWAHDNASREWIETESAHFVFAKSLNTPMMAHVAAFSNADDANALAQEKDGTRLTFDELWRQLGE